LLNTSLPNGIHQLYSYAPAALLRQSMSDRSMIGMGYRARIEAYWRTLFASHLVCALKLQLLESYRYAQPRSTTQQQAGHQQPYEISHYAACQPVLAAV
jgi:hypothetical protein